MADKLFPTFILNKIKQFICFFLFVPAFIIAQNSATGIIKDTNNIPIEGANVIIKTIDTDNIIAYGNSNNNGIFSININSGNYNLKISFLGYKTVVKPIEVKDKNLDLKIITLIKDNTELDEVILKAETNGIIQKGDTTQYKIDKFLNGTEANLKDVIDKLPGININDKGKITANGKEIDRLLIDGENLYKRQHQLATENVSSEMIKNIELIRNYKDFESIQQNNKTSTTALNVTIKNDFKNKFTGNIEIQRGIKNKYKLNLPVFNFNKKVKFSLITNLNNLGESPINIEDYFSLINSEYKSNTSGNSKVIFTNIEDVPRFLSAGNNVKSRTTNFASISTIINLNKKIKIDFYSIFNNTNQHEKFLQNTILNPSFEAIKINEQNNTKEKNYFLALQLKSIYKLNKKTVLTLNNNFNIDNTNQTNSIENNSNNDMKLIKENFTPKKLIFSTSLSLKKTSTKTYYLLTCS